MTEQVLQAIHQPAQKPSSRYFFLSELSFVYGTVLIAALLLALIATQLYDYALSTVLLITLIAALPLGLILSLTIIYSVNTRRALSASTGIQSIRNIIPFARIDTLCIEDSWLRLDELRAHKIWCEGSMIELGEGKKLKQHLTPGLRQLFKSALLCHASTAEDAAERQTATSFGFIESYFEAQHPRGEQPSVPAPLSASLRRTGNTSTLFVKGPADLVLGRSNRILWEGEVAPLTRKQYDTLLNSIHSLRAKGLSVQGYAYRELGKEGKERGERGSSPDTLMIFSGFQTFGGLSKKGAAPNISEFQRIGVHPLIFTELPDHRARALAGDLGLSAGYLDKAKIDALSDEKLRLLLRGVKFIQAGAREREKIVRVLSAAGKRIGFVGSVFEKIGGGEETTIETTRDTTIISAGELHKTSSISSTSSEAALSVPFGALVSQNSLATVLTLISAARTLGVHIQKVVTYTSTGHLAELAILLIALFAGFGTSFTIAQLLLLHILFQVLVGLSYAMEPSDEYVLEYTLRQSSRLFSPRALRHVFVLGTVMALVVFVMMLWYRTSGLDLVLISFSSLFFLQQFHALNARSARISFFKQGMMSNPWLWGALGMNLSVFLVLLYSPLSGLFSLAPLNALDLGIFFVAGSLVFIVREAWKLFIETHEG